MDNQPSKISDNFCVVHGDSRAIARCNKCGHLCRKCIVEVEGKKRCIHCYYSKLTPQKKITDDREEILRSSTTQAAQTEKTLFFPLALTLVLIAVTVLIYASTQYYLNIAGGIAYRIGALAGYSMWIAIVSHLVWRFIFKKRMQIRLLCFSILFFIISAYQSATMLNEVKKTKSTIKDIDSSISDFMAGEQLQQNENRSDDVLTQLSVWLNNHMSNVQQDDLEFNARLEKLIANIPAHETFTNYANMIRAKNELRYFRQLINDYEERLRERDNQALNRIRSLVIENKSKELMITGFREGTRQRDEYFTEYFRIERTIISVSEEMLNFLISRTGKFSIIDGELSFHSQADANVYNNYAQRINLLAEKETKLLDEYNQELFKKSKDYKDLLKSLRPER